MDGVTESDRPDADFSMVERCADLLMLRDNSYELVHSSLGDYLRSLVQARQAESLRAFVELQARAHSIMAETCLTYLLFETFNDPSLTLKNLSLLLDEYPLLEYASLRWGEHLEKVAPEDPDLLQLALTFIRRSSARELSMHYIMDFDRERQDLYCPRIDGSMAACGHSGKSTCLHLASCVGVVPLLDLLDDEEAPLEQPDGYGWYPADYAIYHPKEAAMSWILDKYEQQFAEGSYRAIKANSVLTSTSIRKNWTSTLQRLLEFGHDKEEIDSKGYSPLSYAVAVGRENALDILLAAGADVNKTYYKGETPLITAVLAHCETPSVITALLRHGADVNA